MDSDQELKSLKRGLRAMALINKQGSITISELSRALELPRTTAERVLMTLLAEGFCDRDPQTKRYFLTLRVRSLSHGYTDESWITHVAAPLLFETTKQIGWPLFIATPLGEYMSLRLTTDPATSLNLHRRHIGSEIAMGISSSGLVHLAFLEDEQQRIMLEILRASDDPAQAPARDEARMTYALEQIRRNGFGFGFDLGRERSIAVPIMDKGHVRAVLLMAFITRAIDNDGVARKFAPQLIEMARTIERLAFGDGVAGPLTI
ncbi:helix-turn-helix domain-containing protein [Novosphingobium sp.]|uniref:helix-turn-helix domain-containing protein n=1 Tax=Novosphingobium sp. TaxID=1874826 RepID=UPI0025E4BE8D|nr:helix-turn-helix domain-containing protein [Novosphingobium sp.]